MTIRRAASQVLTVLAGLLSLAVMGHGLVSALGIDTRFDPVLSVLYCILPILSFPVFLLARLLRKLVALQAILFLIWIPVYTTLNWRTCSSLGFCTSVAATVLLTLKTNSVRAFFGVVLLSASVDALERGSRVQTSENERPRSLPPR